MKKTRTLSLVALFAVIIAVASWIAIPTPLGVPLTLQTLAAALCGFLLGAKRGTLSAAVYVLLGALGLPVFSSMQGGLGVLLGPTGGFIFSLPILALFSGIKRAKGVLLPLCGLFLCHTLGTVQFSLVGNTPLLSSFFTASLPFLLKDAGCIFLARYIAGRLKLEEAYD